MDPATDSLSLEQRRAVALAAARRRAAEEAAPPERGVGETVGRAAGLTARAAGPIAAGAAAGAAMGLPLGGVGAGPGAMAGASAAAILQLVDQLGGTNYIEQAMDKLGLPKPENPEENIASGAVKAMGGMGAVTAGAKLALPAASPAVKPTLEAITQNPGLGAVSAASGGAAGEAVKEGGGDATEQLAGSVVGSMVAPAGVGILKTVGGAVGKVAGDLKAAVGSAFGHKPSTERVTADVVKNLTRGEEGPIRDALQNYNPNLVKNAQPTVAEAIAQKNLEEPSRQIGGATVRMQAELSGAKGVENVLPTVAKQQDAAIEEHIRRVREVTGPMRDAALSAAKGNTNAYPVTADLVRLAADYRSIPLAHKVLGSTEQKIRKLLDPKTGKIDPEELYNVRMGIGSDIKKYSEATKNWDAKLTARIEKQVQESIDNAIEAAGATGWKTYLKTYSRGMQRAELFQERRSAAEAIAKGVSGQSTADLVRAELPSIPTLLHRPTMMVNFALKLIAKDATEPVTKHLAQTMTDPKLFLSYMARPAGHPARIKAEEVLIKASVLSNLITRDLKEKEKTE